MVLAQEQTHRSMEENREPRNKPIHLQAIKWQQMRQECMEEKKKSPFNNWCQENWRATDKRMKLEHYITPYRKLNLILNKDINVRLKNIKFLEGKEESYTPEYKYS